MSSNIDFTEPKVVVCVGKPKRGKSNATKYFLLKNAAEKKIFKYGIVFTRTKFNKDYDYIPDQFVYDNYDPTILQRFLDGVSKLENKQPCFVIFDDIQGILNSQDTVLSSLVSNHRHFKCSVFFNFQYLYARGSTPLLRECSSLAVMFNSKGTNTLKGLYENFGQLFPDFASFKEHFFQVTKEPYTAMLFVQDIDTLEDNYMYFKAPDMSDINLKLDY